MQLSVVYSIRAKLYTGIRFRASLRARRYGRARFVYTLHIHTKVPFASCLLVLERL